MHLKEPLKPNDICCHVDLFLDKHFLSMPLGNHIEDHSHWAVGHNWL